MRRNPQEGKRKQKEKTSLQERKRKTSLTLTGLLMEGLEDYFRIARHPGITAEAFKRSYSGPTD